MEDYKICKKNIKKIILLFSFIFTFLVSNYAHAITYNYYYEDFDSYSTGQLNNNYYWADSSEGVVATSSLYNSPYNSIYKTGTDIINFFSTTTDDTYILKFDFYFKNRSTDRQNFLYLRSKFATGTETISKVYLQPGQTVYSPDGDILLKNESSSVQYSLAGTNSLATSTWHTLYLEYDKSESLIRGQINNNEWSSWLATENTNYKNFNNFYISSPYGTTHDFYYDNFIIDSYLSPTPKDEIIIEVPDSDLTYDFNNLYWKFKYQLSTSTINQLNNDNDLLLFLNYKNNQTGKIRDDLAWNLTNFYNDESFVLPYTNTYYFLNDYNVLNIPNEIGEYTANATLKMLNYSSQTLTDIIATTTIFEIVNIGSSTAPTKPFASSTEASLDNEWCNNLCSGLETNWYNILNNIYCAGKYLICWSFLPHYSTLEKFNGMYDLYTTKFPMSAYYSLASTTKNAFYNASTTTSNVISVPMVRNNGTSSQYYMMPVLSSSSFSNLIGDSNASSFRTGLKYIIWLIFGIIIWIIVF